MTYLYKYYKAAVLKRELIDRGHADYDNLWNDFNNVLSAARRKLFGVGLKESTKLPQIEEADDLEGLVKCAGILDCRIQLNYEPAQLAVLGLDKTFVASHMKTVHSISRNRLSMRASYGSEPLLVECAAHQLEIWRRNYDTRKYDKIDPAIRIL